MRIHSQLHSSIPTCSRHTSQNIPRAIPQCNTSGRSRATQVHVTALLPCRVSLRASTHRSQTAIQRCQDILSSRAVIPKALSQLLASLIMESNRPRCWRRELTHSRSSNNTTITQYHPHQSSRLFSPHLSSSNSSHSLNRSNSNSNLNRGSSKRGRRRNIKPRSSQRTPSRRRSSSLTRSPTPSTT